jgi:hypothetical protein
MILLTDGKSYGYGCWCPIGKYDWAFIEREIEEGYDDNGYRAHAVDINAWHRDAGPTHWMPFPDLPKVTT